MNSPHSTRLPLSSGALYSVLATAIAALVLIPFRAEAQADTAPAERLRRAISQLQSNPQLALQGSIVAERAERGGAAIVMGGMGGGDPFQGEFEIIRSAKDTAVVSKQALPGFTYLNRQGRRARSISYEESPIDIKTLTHEIESLLDWARLAQQLEGVEWNVVEEDAATIYSAELNTSILPPPPSPRGRRVMGMPQAKVLAVRSSFTLGADDQLMSMRFEIDRSDPLSAMIQLGGRGNNDNKVGSSRSLTLAPITATRKRTQRQRLELLAGLAQRSKEGSASQPPTLRRGSLPPGRGATPKAASKPTAAMLAQQVKARLQKTLAKYDHDNDGKLSKEETGDRWIRLAKYDSNADERVDLDELIAGYKARKDSDKKAATPDSGSDSPK